MTQRRNHHHNVHNVLLLSRFFIRRRRRSTTVLGPALILLSAVLIILCHLAVPSASFSATSISSSSRHPKAVIPRAFPSLGRLWKKSNKHRFATATSSDNNKENFTTTTDNSNTGTTDIVDIEDELPPTVLVEVVNDENADNSEHDHPSSLTTSTTGGSITPTAAAGGVSSSSSSSQQAILLLNLVAVLWGSQHAIIKMVVEDSDPGVFTFIRFGLAAVLASIPSLLFMDNNQEQDQQQLDNQDNNNDNTTASAAATAWRWGLEMGFWMFLGFSFQAIGLETTTAQRSGFLLYLNVKFVPFFARVLLGRDISLITWLSCFTAFTGTALLATAGGTGGGGADDGGTGTIALINNFHLNVGDWWSIAAAAASAMFILRLEKASSEVKDSSALNSACLWTVTLFAGVWTIYEATTVAQGQQADTGNNLLSLFNEISTTASSHGIELLYLSGVTTALANWIQTKAQREVSAEKACVVYALDPVYGAVFSNLLLGETLGGVTGWIGAFLITIAAATNALLETKKSSSSSSPSTTKGVMTDPAK